MLTFWWHYLSYALLVIHECGIAPCWAASGWEKRKRRAEKAGLAEEMERRNEQMKAVVANNEAWRKARNADTKEG